MTPTSRSRGLFAFLLSRASRLVVAGAGRVAVLAACLGLACAAAYALYEGVATLRGRTLRACAVTDFGFRQDKRNSEDRLRLWFGEVNRIYRAAGVTWDVQVGGNAYPEKTTGDLESLKSEMDARDTCGCDVLVGFSGERDPATSAAVSPFGHSVLISTRGEDSDVVVVTRLAQTLARLFGAAIRPGAMVGADPADAGVMDRRTVKLIAELRQYDFARGIAALPGKWENRAQRALTAALTGSSSSPAVDAHRALGRAFAEARMHANAVAQLRQAVEAGPTDARSRFELSLELAADSRVDEAIRELQNAARLDPEDARPRAALGALLFNQKRYESAADELRAATKLDPHAASYQALLGAALAQQPGTTEGAEAALNAALRADRRNQEAIDTLASLRQARAGVQEELGDAEKNARENPGSVQAHLDLAIALLDARRNDEAERQLDRTLELDPRNGVAHHALARMKYAAGDYAAAARELEKAQAAGAYVAADFLDAVKRRLAGN